MERDMRNFITIVESHEAPECSTVTEGAVSGPHTSEDGDVGVYIIKGVEAPAIAAILDAHEGGPVVPVGSGHACLRRGKLYISRSL